MNVALLAPSYNSVHGNVLENIKQQITRRLVEKQASPLESGKVIVLDQSFWSQRLSPPAIIRKLFRANVTGIFILIRYGQSVRMRVQLDEVVSNLFSVDQGLPLLPICVFFYGSRPVSRREKLRIQAMFKTHLAEQVDIPPVLFAQRLLQLRHCYSEFLREDKIADIMKWMKSQMKLCATFSWRSYAASYHAAESSTQLHEAGDANAVLRNLVPTRSRRRSLSEPKIVPNLRGYIVLVCEEARRVPSNSFSMSIRKVALRQLLNGDKHWTDNCQEFKTAERIHGIFSILTASRDKAYGVLSSRVTALKAQHGHTFRPRKHELFLTNFSWSVQCWNNRTSHAVMRCAIGFLGHTEVFGFANWLNAQELRLLRSHILEYYANFDKRTIENRSEKLSPAETLARASLHRSHSIHDFRSFMQREILD
ncbi:uncharacterized protein LOC129588081 [Paramacrobiotus metropolitanus]|uniref:uncharacterized protein LOC129588081 n=1 Tax=Paramacrobiotus metropolitanus TaxID=2943436 RepID=UPI002445E0C4|nr:uncharacterized protein LOC129588081 [Paramacrobiotus metropolitanus]